MLTSKTAKQPERLSIRALSRGTKARQRSSKPARISEASAPVRRTQPERTSIRALSRGTKARQRLSKGQALIETVVGIALLIPLGLFSYDLTCILMANENNEKLADTAARAAANHGDSLTAQQAAQQAIDDFQGSTNYKITLTDFEYNAAGNGQISVTTQIDIKLPVSFGSWKAVSLNAEGVQPIVGIPVAR